MHLCEVLTDGDGLTSRVRLRSRASLGLSVPSRCTQKYQTGRKLQLLFSAVVKESFIKATFHLRACQGQECWYSLMDTPFLGHNSSYIYLNRCTHTKRHHLIRATRPLPLPAIYLYLSVSVIAQLSAAHLGCPSLVHADFLLLASSLAHTAAYFHQVLPTCHLHDIQGHGNMKSMKNVCVCSCLLKPNY